MAKSQLDHYLETIEGRLRNLPLARRQDEIREIRQHLEALAAGHRLAGLSEEEAAEAAIRQFGHAEQIGQALSKASRQKRMQTVWLLLIAVLTMVVNLVIFAINDYPDTWFAKFVMAFALSSGILALGVIEIVQNYWRARNQQTRA
jgi:uncharacterized integral membrane protein